MAVPLIQQIRVGAYILGKRLKGVTRYPLVLMLEPLFRCNLACLERDRLSVREELAGHGELLHFSCALSRDP